MSLIFIRLKQHALTPSMANLTLKCGVYNRSVFGFDAFEKYRATKQAEHTFAQLSKTVNAQISESETQKVPLVNKEDVYTLALLCQTDQDINTTVDYFKK